MSIRQIVKKKNSLVNQILKVQIQVYSIDDSETEKEEICMIIEKQENQPKKTPLNLENLVQPLESK